jgi:[ribosomal protein S5]-alanine N-acetyltransferase
MIKQIQTKKFTLRPFRMSDAESIRKHANDKAVSRNLSSLPHPYTKRDANFWLGKQVKLQRQKNPENIVFAIEINEEVVGSIGLHKIKRGHKAELGYWLGREFWGGGIMTDAIKDVVKFGFGNLKLRRIHAGVFLFNKGSARVLEKNGFKLEGISKKEIKKDEKFIDAYIFAKVR